MRLKKLKLVFLYFVLALPALTHANSYVKIDYTISRLSQEQQAIKIDAEIQGKLTNTLKIDLPFGWAGIDYSNQIKNIKVEESSYNFTLHKEDESYYITIPLAAPKDKIKISYEIHQKAENPSDVHEVIIRDNLIHSPGYGLFALPSDIKSKQKLNFTLNWQDIPNEWVTLSSHGIERSLRFKAKASRLLHSIYVAGRVRIYEIGTKENPVYLSLQGKFKIKDEYFISSLKEIISAQKEFFNDYDFPFYAISIIEGKGRHSWGGTRLFQSFTAYMPTNMKQSNYYLLFAHEHLHNWLGGKIRKSNKERMYYWWSEGFTDYYARILSIRSKGITFKKFVAELNEFLGDYYLSPVINEPNARIQKDFWQDYDVEKLPYYRGFVFAIYLNDLIKRNNPNNSLDNVILDLFKTAKQKSFSAEYFQNIIKNYIPQGIEKEITEFIFEGKTINLDSVMQVLPIEKVSRGTYELGFDKEALAAKKVIMNIIPESNAYKAGLREGDKVISWHIPRSRDPSKPVAIKKGNKIFKFKPENVIKRDVYQLKTNLSKEDKQKIKSFFDIK